MTFRPVTVALLSALFVCILCGTALAQGDRRAAARLFRAGEHHFDDDEYEEALTSFRSSLEIYMHPATQFNIALCLERLGRLREADEVLAQVERGNRRRIARKARYARTRIAAAVPTLRVAPGSEGATVVVDGEACPAPCERRVDPGQHEVVVAENGSEHRETLQLRAGQTFQLSLQRMAPALEAAEAEPDSSSNGARSVGPILAWGGAGLTVVGIVGMLYFGLSEDPSTLGALVGLGLTVAGLGVATTGLVLTEGGERPLPTGGTTARGLRLTLRF